MTTRRRRSSSRTRGGRRPKTTWENVNFEMSFTAAASVSVADLSMVVTQTEGFQRPTKIIRSIIDLTWSQNAFNDEPQSLGIGIWVVQHEGLTGDGAADVINDFQQDFYFWTTLFSLQQGANTQAARFRSWDIRTSRNIRGGYGLLFKAQNETQESAMKLQVAMRNLWVPAP